MAKIIPASVLAKLNSHTHQPHEHDGLDRYINPKGRKPATAAKPLAGRQKNPFYGKAQCENSFRISGHVLDNLGVVQRKGEQKG